MQNSIITADIPRIKISIAPNLLAYKDGVKSQHNDLLSQQAGFTNVRDHLIVKNPKLIQSSEAVVVIDDVCTTGASLIYAEKYLRAAGAVDVKCLVLAKNIGNVLT